ncbi:glycoside hydrolase family 16 protein [Lichenihabitans psoromatis]|uniref:glycoside hydrolase family 16 protein n=1 Tax=Lichenihabitans psoromatis TaxID=2528642 RepID=UPI001FDF3D79|nr:glycoside hydrolase family 16 protein [Lichenihabitans psoromatis]
MTQSGATALLLMRAATLLWISVSAAVMVSCSGRAATLDLSNYAVTFEDSFHTLDISDRGPGTRWISHTPWNGDFGDAVFENPGPLGPFSLTPQGLRITAAQDAGGKWHAGLICSMDKDGVGQKGFSQQYGYFEIKAKLPAGPGTWPAFWLIGIDKSKAVSEIDVFEYYGATPSVFHSVAHIWKDGKDVHQQGHVTNVAPDLLSGNFNTFGVLIEPDQTRVYLNRNEVWSTPTPPEYRQPMYILANLALGGGWPIKELKSPVAMTIEYIRVYQDRRLPDGKSNP